MNAELPILAEELLKVSHQRLSKAFYLKDFSAFKAKYPLLCIPHPCSSELQAITSMSRFPSELKKDTIYFGNLTNVLSRDFVQLKMLGIKTVVHFTPERFESLEKEFNCIHYEVKTFNKELETLPIHTITEQIQSQVLDKKEKLPMFIFCVNGYLSGAVAVKLLMETNKTFSKELAVASVMNKRYELKDMPHWLYTMI